jgi:hypothetical protein
MVVWIVEGTWPACVDAARTHMPEGADVVLLHVTPADVPGAAHGAFAGLLGRGHPERDPGTRVEQLAEQVVRVLVGGAATRVGVLAPPTSCWVRRPVR